jgi:hypothetical protein
MAKIIIVPVAEKSHSNNFHQSISPNSTASNPTVPGSAQVVAVRGPATGGLAIRAVGS